MPQAHDIVPSAPRSPYRVLLPLGVAVCLSLFGDLTLFAVLVTQLEVVGITLAAAGIMLGIHRLIRIPGNPLAGLLFDRWGRRPLFILGMICAVLSTASYGLVRGFWPFLTARLLWGLAWILINVGGLTMVLDISTNANRGRIAGFYNSWMLAGLALGPLVGGFLVDGLGFRTALRLCAGLTALGLAVALFALPETRPARRERPHSPALSLQAGSVLRATAFLRANPGLLSAAGLYLITQFAGEGLVLSTVSLLLQQHYGAGVPLGALALRTASAAGLLLALRSLLAGLVGPLAGHGSDRRLGRRAVVVGSLLAGIAAFGTLAAADSLLPIVLGIVLSAVSGGAAMATLAACAGDLSPPGRQGAVIGVYAMAGDMGSASAPFLAFGLLSVLDLQWVYLLCALLFVAGLALLPGIPARQAVTGG